MVSVTIKLIYTQNVVFRLELVGDILIHCNYNLNRVKCLGELEVQLNNY